MTQRTADDFGPDPRDEDESDGLVPPFDEAAEVAVVTSCLADGGRVALVDFLTPEHFYVRPCAEVWAAVCELRRGGQPVDMVTVATLLNEKKRLPIVGGAAGLDLMVQSAPAIGNPRAYALTVHNRWRLRQAVLVGQKIVARGYAEPITDVQGFLDEASRSYVQIGRDSPASPIATNSSVLRRLAKEMSEAANLQGAEGRLPGLPTSIRSLDLKTLGIKPGSKTTLAALTGRGKTSLALQVSTHNAKRGVGVMYFGTEQTREELVVKQLANEAQIDSQRIELARARPTLTADEWERLSKAIAVLEGLPLFIDDRPDLTAEQIVATVRQACQQSMVSDAVPIGLVVVDHLHRLKPPAHMEKKREDEQLGHSSSQLKELAKTEQIAVLECAQSNIPDPKQSPSGKPYPFLVRGSKRIEQESDHVWHVWRKKKNDKRDSAIVITKQRGGEEGAEVDVTFEVEFSRFVDPAYAGFRSAFEDFR